MLRENHKLDIPTKICSLKIFAQLCNISESEVKQLTASGIIEETSPGYYNLCPAALAYIRYLEEVNAGKRAAIYNSEKARLTRLKCEDAEMNLQVKRQELHHATDVEFITDNMRAAFTATLKSWSQKLAMRLAQEDHSERIIEIMQGAIDEALNELSAYEPGMFDENAYLAKMEDAVTDEQE